MIRNINIKLRGKQRSKFALTRKRKFGIFSGGVVAVIALLVAMVPLLGGTPARAATGMAAINVSYLYTLGGSTNNAGSPTESYWRYDDTNKYLLLYELDGNYTLTGVNPDLTVYVYNNNINVTFDNLHLSKTAFPRTLDSISHDNLTITLVGSNTATNGYAGGSAWVTNNTTINGNGSLTLRATNGGGMSLMSGKNLTLSGNATLSVENDGNYSTIDANGGNTITVGAGAYLDAADNGLGYGINALSGDLHLNVNGSATFWSSSLHGIRLADGRSLFLTGSGEISASGGGYQTAISTNQPITMGDGGLVLGMWNDSGDPEIHIFATASTATHQWKLDDSATTSNELTDATITVEVAAGELGTITRVRKGGGGQTPIGGNPRTSDINVNLIALTSILALAGIAVAGLGIKKFSTKQ